MTRLVPTYPADKKLSKNEILRLAIKYIRLLSSVLEYQKQHDDSGHSSSDQGQSSNSSDDCDSNKSASKRKSSQSNNFECESSIELISDGSPASTLSSGRGHDTE